MLQSKGKTVLAILGHSKGGDSVVTYAAKYDDIPKIVNVSGRFHLDKGITSRFGEDVFVRLKKEKRIQAHDVTASSGPDGWTLTEQDMNARLSHNMIAICQAIQKCTVLTIHGGADKTTPVEDAHEFTKYIKHHRLVVIEGASHNYNGAEHSKEMIQIAVEFMTAV
ncbi:hypothetical protein ABBQ32_008563 [Trebouxia sp. C0010 RCD-2024]